MPVQMLRRLLLLVIAAGASHPAAAQVPAPVAVVIEQQGDVRVTSSVPRGRSRHLRIHDTVRTGPGGSARIAYVSGARVYIGPNARYEVQDPARTIAASGSGRALRTLFSMLAEAVGAGDAAASGDGTAYEHGPPEAPVLLLASPGRSFLPLQGDTLALHWSRAPGPYRVVLYRLLDPGQCDGYTEEVATTAVTDTTVLMPWPAGVAEVRVEVEGRGRSAPTCFRRQAGTPPVAADTLDATLAPLQEAADYINANLLANAARALARIRHPRAGQREMRDDLWTILQQRTQYAARLRP